MTQSEKILDYLRATPAGATRVEIGAALGISRAQTGKLIDRMMAVGSIVGVAEGGKGKDTRTKRYSPYSSASTKPAEFRRAKQRTAAPARPFEGDARITSETRVTICPPFVDRRFEFDPPPGWRGAITQDWLASRLQGHA